MLPLFQLHIFVRVISAVFPEKADNDFPNQALTAAENMI
jgi:hypothetical protein